MNIVTYSFSVPHKLKSLLNKNRLFFWKKRRKLGHLHIWCGSFSNMFLQFLILSPVQSGVNRPSSWTSAGLPACLKSRNWWKSYCLTSNDGLKSHAGPTSFSWNIHFGNLQLSCKNYNYMRKKRRASERERPLTLWFCVLPV